MFKLSQFKLIKFIKLPAEFKGLLIEATFYSALYRWRILHKPFKKIAKTIGTFRYETEQMSYEDPQIRQIGKAVAIMSYHVPWNSLCLDRALAAKKMLNKRGYPCTLYMGVRQNDKKEMTAHAWVRCGTTWVSGGNGNGYAITGIYGDKTMTTH